MRLHRREDKLVVQQITTEGVSNAGRIYLIMRKYALLRNSFLKDARLKAWVKERRLKKKKKEEKIGNITVEQFNTHTQTNV